MSAQKNNKGLSVLISIESGLVRGSLMLPSSASPYIFHTVSSEIITRLDGNESKSGAKLLAGMLTAVASVSESLAHDGLKICSAKGITIPISKINIVFSSPWIFTNTKTVLISYANGTEITQKTVNNIVNVAREEMEQKILSSTYVDLDLAFIEQKIFEVKLNGYPTLNFQGKKAYEIEVSFAVSIGSKNILNQIEKTIEKFIRTPERNIHYHSSLLLQYSALRTVGLGNDDYIVIHIHNEISDIIVIKKSICAAIASFPVGTALLSQISAVFLGQSQEITHSSLNLLSKNAFHSAENNRVTSITNSSLNKWSNQFVETLSTLGPIDALPRRIYLLANEHYGHFERALSGVKPLHFKVIPIEKSVLDSAIQHENKEKEDVLMSLYAYALM